MDDYYVPASPEHKKREKEKARRLRQSQWWRQQVGLRRCHYCGDSFSINELTMDHKIPISRGGRSVKGNVVPCCKDCNTNKSHKTIVEMKLEAMETMKSNDSSGD